MRGNPDEKYRRNLEVACSKASYTRRVVFKWGIHFVQPHDTQNSVMARKSRHRHSFIITKVKP